MTSTRREFLNLTASSLALLALGPTLRTAEALAGDQRREYLMLCDSDKDSVNLLEAFKVTDPGPLKVLDVKSGECFDINLPFFGHTATQNPAQPHQVATFEKWGKCGALVDVREKSVVTLAQSTEEHIFFGHCAFTPDGSMVIVTEDTYGHDRGKLVVRDASNLKIIRVMETYGAKPHQCQMLDDGKTILVMNSGNMHMANDHGSLAWIDLETGQLLKKVDFDRHLPGNFTKHLYAAYGHFDISFDGWICCCGAGKTENLKDSHAEYHAIIAFVSPQGEVRYSRSNDTFLHHGQALSIAILGQTGLAAYTIAYGGDVVLVFDYKTQRLVKRIEAKGCYGLVPSIDSAGMEHNFIISTKTALLQADFIPHQPAHTSILNTALCGFGAHLTRMYV